jgi:hypothetical protein
VNRVVGISSDTLIGDAIRGVIQELQGTGSPLILIDKSAQKLIASAKAHPHSIKKKIAKADYHASFIIHLAAKSANCIKRPHLIRRLVFKVAEPESQVGIETS